MLFYPFCPVIMSKIGFEFLKKKDGWGLYLVFVLLSTQNIHSNCRKVSESGKPHLRSTNTKRNNLSLSLSLFFNGITKYLLGGTSSAQVFYFKLAFDKNTTGIKKHQSVSQSDWLGN